MANRINAQNGTEKTSGILPTIFLALAGTEAFITAWFYTSQPAELENTILFGLSTKKLFLFAGLIGLGLALCALALSMWRGGNLLVRTKTLLNDSVKRERGLKILLWVSAALWLILAIPSAWFGKLEAYFSIIEPIIFLVFLIALQAIFLLNLGNANENLNGVNSFVAEHKKTIQLWVGIMFTMCAVWALIAISKLGLDSHQEDYWYEAGVPVLGLQALAGMIVGLTLHWYERQYADLSKSRRLDAILFFAIWILSGTMWALTPAPNGFLNPGPYPPAYETYPFADAAKYDLMSQFALIGQGINNSESYNRPAYPALLVLEHVLTGQDYDRNMQLQAALLGLFPALIYLIGKNLLSRGAGLAGATVIGMRGVNGILATSTLNLANQKQMLADFPTAVGICAVILLCIHWLQSPQKKHLALWAGGLLALTAYLRPTTIGLLPLLLIVPMMIKSYSWRMRATTAAMVFAGFVLVMIPWEVRGALLSENYKYPTPIAKILTVVGERYPSIGIVTPEPDKNNRPPLDRPIPNEGKKDDSKKDGRRAAVESGGFSFIANHLFHNLSTSALTLPNSAGYQSLRPLIKGENSVWTQTWDGALGLGGSLSLLINLALVALGVAVCIQQRAWAGLFPVATFGAYQLANSLGRTSGGRYLVPVDWILVLFFCFGLFQVGQWVCTQMGIMRLATVTRSWRKESEAGGESQRKLSLIASACLFGLGLLLVLPDITFKQEFIPRSRTQLMERLLGFDLQGKESYVLEFLKDPASVILEGRILYPRYYNVGDGEVPTFYPYRVLDFPRIAFEFIGPDRMEHIIMAAPSPNSATKPAVSFSFNAADVILLGCTEKTHVEVILLVFYEQPIPEVFSRQPDAPAHCPLPKPVCTEEGVCE